MSLAFSAVRHAPVCAAHQIERPSISFILKVWSERRSLARLDESRLADLGITSATAAREAARPIWDLPVRYK